MNHLHLDDDALSATLDGEGTAEEAAHLVACVPCAARTDQLRRAARAVGQPVAPVPAARRDAAVQAALRAAVTPLAARRRRPPTWLAGAAAVLIALAIAVPVLARGGTERTSSEASGEAATSTTATGSDSAKRAAPSATSGVAETDLGPIGVADVAERVTAALRSPGSRATDGDSVAAADQSSSCLAAVVAADPLLGRLRLVASATFGGSPVQVLAFDLDTTTGPSLRVHVLGVRNCDDVVPPAVYPAP